MLIRNLVAASLVVLLGASGNAFAQQGGFEGLDLTDDAPKKDAKDAKDSGKDGKDKKKPDADASDGLDLSDPAEKTPDRPASRDREKKADETRKPVVKKEDDPAVERDVTQDDRVKSVQRKLYLKRGRFELAPYVAININDPFYTKVGGALRAAFHPADTLAFSARFTLMQTAPTDDVRTAKKNLQSRIFFSVPYWSGMVDAEWSPLYGKVSFLNSILHIDGYLAAGGGVVYTETSATNDDSRNGLKPAFDLGIGLRFVAKDFLAVNIALMNTTYVDTPVGTTKSGTQNLMMLNAGVSIFFPFKSSYREAE